MVPFVKTGKIILSTLAAASSTSRRVIGSPPARSAKLTPKSAASLNIESHCSADSVGFVLSFISLAMPLLRA